MTKVVYKYNPLKLELDYNYNLVFTTMYNNINSNSYAINEPKQQQNKKSLAKYQIKIFYDEKKISEEEIKTQVYAAHVEILKDLKNTLENCKLKMSPTLSNADDRKKENPV